MSFCSPLAINLVHLPSLPGFVKSSLCSLSPLHICCSTRRSSASVIIALKCLFLKFLRSPNYWIQQSPLRFYLTSPFCRFCHYGLPSSLEQFSLYYLALSLYPCPPPIFWNTLFYFPLLTHFSAHRLNTCMILHCHPILLLPNLILVLLSSALCRLSHLYL